jgi:hypothetical protein
MTGPPDERGRPGITEPADTSQHPPAAATAADSAAESSGYLRLRGAWQRRPRFECGCTDPCRCDYRQNPSAKRVDAYRQAVRHLAACGLPAARLDPEERALREWAEVPA